MSKYREINGKKYPRVTTILGIIAKPELYGWYAKHGQNAAEIVRVSAQRGSDVHHAIEALQSGHAWDDVINTLDKEPQKYLLGYKKFQEEWNYSRDPDAQNIAHYKQTKKFNEKLVWSETNGYCGEVDEFGILKHKKNGIIYDNVLIDYKTSSGIYFEHKLQVAAYRRALIEMGNECHTAGVLRCTNTGNYELKIFGEDQLDDYFEVFLSAKKIWEAKEREYFT